MRREFSPFLKGFLLFFTILSILVGISMTIWSGIIQIPPKYIFNIFLTALGVCTLLLGLWGTWQTFCTSCCLGLFIVLGILLTGLDVALVIKAATSNYYIAERLAQYDVLYNGTSTADTAQLVSDYQSKIKVPSYIFLAPLILQSIACICLCLARIFKPYKADIEDQDEEQSRRSTLAQVQLESLKRSTKKGSAGQSVPETNLYTSSSKMYKSVSRKMSDKYGEFTQDPAFQQKWWNRIPGL